MAITDIDDDLDEHDDDLTRESPDDTDLVRKLRSQLKTTGKRARKADELEKENRTLKGEQMLAKAGLTKGGEPVSLSDRQKQTLLREVGDTVTPEALLEAAVELGWAEKAEDPVQQEIDKQDQMSRDAKGAAPKSAGEITPEQAGEWNPQRLREFRRAHPAEFEALKRGETVTVTA